MRERVYMTRVLAAAFLVAVLAFVAGGVPLALANPIADGNVVDLQAANDFGKTLDFYIRTYGVQILGTVIGVGSLSQMGKFPGAAAGGVAGGVGMIFWPSIMGSGQTQAQAFTGSLGVTPSMAVQGVTLVAETSAIALAALCYRLSRKEG